MWNVILCLCLLSILTYATQITLPLYPLVHLLGDGEGHWGYGIEYAFNLEIGTPKQLLPVVLDSGSPGVIIYGSGCQLPDCEGRDTFDFNTSSSWTPLNKTADANYIAGSLRGVYGTDDMWFAEGYVNFAVAVMQFVNWTMPYFADFNFSGIFGASMSPVQAQNVSFIYQAYHQGLIEQNIFGVMASMDPYEEGEVIFGGYNVNATVNGITWHDVKPFEPVPGHIINWLWSLPATNLSVNGKVLNGSCTNPATPCIVIVDTGGALMKFTGPGMPDLAVASDCSNLMDLPTISLQIESQVLELTPLDYVFKFEGNGTGPAMCVSNAFGVDGDSITATVAGRFFSKFYTVFDNANQMVGFSTMHVSKEKK